MAPYQKGLRGFERTIIPDKGTDRRTRSPPRSGLVQSEKRPFRPFRYRPAGPEQVRRCPSRWTGGMRLAILGPAQPRDLKAQADSFACHICFTIANEMSRRSHTPKSGSKDSQGRPIAPDVANELQTAYLRSKPAAMALRMWRRLFSEGDRELLGGDVEEAYQRMALWACGWKHGTFHSNGPRSMLPVA
jgi:hypothetical protein